MVALETLRAGSGSAPSALDESASGAARRTDVLRLGVVSYLNAVPMVHGLAGDPRFRLERDTPARIAEKLHRGEIDLGLIPSIEYAAGDYAIVPGLAIASHGSVRSVCLVHRGPLEAVRRVALDTSSRTSAAMLKILLRAQLQRDPEYVALPPDVPAMLDAADAALVIGDVALYLEGQPDLGRLDLGQAWTASTGLPFVYAFWAGRPGVATRADAGALRAALRAGLEAVPQIAAAYGARGDSSDAARRALNEEYLRSHIVYTLRDPERRGLREFYRLAHLHGLIPRVPELRFHDDP